MKQTSTVIEHSKPDNIDARSVHLHHLPYHEVSNLIKNSRKEAGITQDQLARKIGTSKSYISKIESGNADIQLSTLFRIFETGFGRKLIFNLI